MTISLEQIQLEVAVYLGITLDGLEQRIKECRQFRAEEWDNNPPQTPEELDEYYRNDQHLLPNLVDFNRWAYDVHFPTPSNFGDKILDFGCGMAYTAEHMANAGKDITIADLNTVPFQFAQERLKAKQITFDAIELHSGMLQLKDTYDAIFCIDVIEHLVNPLEMLWHFHEHLSPGGKLYITNLEAKHDDIHRDHIIYQPPQIMRMMDVMGWIKIDAITWQK